MKSRLVVVRIKKRVRASGCSYNRITWKIYVGILILSMSVFWMWYCCMLLQDVTTYFFRWLYLVESLKHFATWIFLRLTISDDPHSFSKYRQFWAFDLKICPGWQEDGLRKLIICAEVLEQVLKSFCLHVFGWLV